MQSSVLVEPAWFTHPDYVETLGPEVGDIARLAGFPPDPEQQLVLDAMLGIDKHKNYVAFEVCVIAPRQNLKTGLFKMAALGKAFLLERPLFVWSAHEFSTTQEAFRDLTILIESTPELDRRVANIYRGNGDEAILLKNGSRIKFKARTKAGGRGLTGDDVLLDEAFALKPEHMGALMPTLSARPNPQIIYGSSAGLVDSDVLRGVRDRGRVGSSPRLLYVEWGNDRGGCLHNDCDHSLGSEGCALDDPILLDRANTQRGRRISEGYIAAERQALPPMEFARERLGWWDEPGLTDAFFGEGKWEALATDKKPPYKAPTFGIARSVSQAWTSIGYAEKTKRGTWHLAPVERAPGADWLITNNDPHRESVRELHRRFPDARWVIATTGPASALIDDVVAEVGESLVLPANSAQLCDASADVYDRVQEKAVEHRAYPELDASVADAERRDSGDRWAIGRKTDDVSMFEAVTLALWGASQPEEPEMTPMFGFA